MQVGSAVNHPYNTPSDDDCKTTPLILPQDDGSFIDVEQVRWFRYQKRRFWWDAERLHFRPLAGLDSLKSEDVSNDGGLSSRSVAARLALYGPNAIHVRLDPIVQVILLQALNPFYIFQVFSVSIWFYDGYEKYAACIVAISLLSLALTTYETRRVQLMLRDRFHASGNAFVLRSDGGGCNKSLLNAGGGKLVGQQQQREAGIWKETTVHRRAGHAVSSDELVPGDVIVVPPTGACFSGSGNAIV